MGGGYPGAGGPPGGYPGAGGAAGQAPAAKPARPEDVAQWKPDDYKSAVRDGDPAFETAVAQLGGRQGDAEAAELLAALLDELGKPQQAGAGAAAGAGPGGGGGYGPPGAGGASYGPPGQAGGGPPPGMGTYGPGDAGPPGGPPPGMGTYGPPGAGGAGGPPPGMGTYGPPGAGGMGPGGPPPGMGTYGPPGRGGSGAPGNPAGPMGWNGSSPRGIAPSSVSMPPASPLTILAAAAIGWQDEADPGYDPGQADAGAAPDEMEAYPAGYDPDAANAGVDPAAAGAGGAYGGYGQPAGGQGRRVGREAMFDAILKALVGNGSPQAWQTIERLLKGEINTGLDDEAVVDRVLAALLANYAGADHPTGMLLNRALAAPEQLRAAGAAQKVSAADLRQKVLDMHTTSAASALDALLGVPDASAQRTGTGRGPGQGGYGPPGAGGVGGPGADFGAEDAAVDGAMEAAPGGQAGGVGFGGPQNAGAVSATALKIEVRPLSPDEARRALEYLGQAELLQTIEAQIRGLNSVTDGSAGKQLALAASLPAPALRAAQCELLQQHWLAGADSLTAQRLFEIGPRDPGFLVVLKSVPMLKTLPLRQPPSGRAQQENQVKHSWANAARQLVRTLNARFYAAALNRSGSATAVPPVRLHTGANIAAEYRFVWPDDAGSLPAGLAEPFVVHYVRVDAGKVNPQQVLTHYEKQVRGGSRAAFALNNHEAWIEHEGVADTPSRRRSIDILLTTGGGGGGGGGGGPGAYAGGGGGGGNEQNVTVEILSIEIPNPRPSTRDVARAE
ncbi:MAG TPA: hypothetical protein VML55_01710 [Planctomycetaceae bacterium]|nr:hypothetical protein [Planctomycetaceae bacterium]